MKEEIKACRSALPVCIILQFQDLLKHYEEYKWQRTLQINLESFYCYKSHHELNWKDNQLRAKSSFSLIRYDEPQLRTTAVTDKQARQLVMTERGGCVVENLQLESDCKLPWTPPLLRHLHMVLEKKKPSAQTCVWLCACRGIVLISSTVISASL